MEESTTPAKHIVLITGANQGIGFQVAKHLAAEHQGYYILMGSRDIERGNAAAVQLQQANLEVEAIQIDVTDDVSIAQAAHYVESKFNKLDVLINNAGISNDSQLGLPGASVRQLYMEQFNTNLFGAAQVTESFLPLLQNSPVARIVFTSSAVGSLATRMDEENKFHQSMIPIYRASKAGLNMLCLHYAARFKKQGWKVNAVDPGHVATNLNRFKGPDPVESGATQLVRMATLGADGPTGTFSNTEGQVPW